MRRHEDKQLATRPNACCWFLERIFLLRDRPHPRSSDEVLSRCCHVHCVSGSKILAMGLASLRGAASSIHGAQRGEASDV